MALSILDSERLDSKADRSVGTVYRAWGYDDIREHLARQSELVGIEVSDERLYDRTCLWPRNTKAEFMTLADESEGLPVDR